MSLLDDLLSQADDAAPTERIRYREPIAAHGSAAIAPLAERLRDRRLAAFAVRVLERIGQEPANQRAVAAALAGVDGTDLSAHVAEDVDRVLSALGHHARVHRRPPSRGPSRAAGAGRHGASWSEQEYRLLFERFPPEGPHPARPDIEQLAAELGRSLDAVAWQWEDGATFVRGGSASTSSQQLMAWLDSESVEIVDPVILVRINRLYRPDMTPTELYDTTRRSWLVGDRRGSARYALALYTGRVLEAYQVDGWFKAVEPGRWEFVGRVADDRIRDRYVGRSVKSYLVHGNQHPIVYVNC